MPIHILNGDSLAEKFPLNESFLVFRECLIDGPKASLDLPEFWDERAKYIARAFNTTPEQCRNYVLKELSRLSHTNEEICCWFEFDLFCQANLWFIIHYIEKSIEHSTISIVQPDAVSDVGWSGFGNLDAQQLLNRYSKRTKVDHTELHMALALWDAYRRDDLKALEGLSMNQSRCFPKLKEVIRVHMERFPREGYGRPKRRLLEIKHLGIHQFEKVFSAFQETEAIYGFGDAQVKLMLENLNQSP